MLKRPGVHPKDIGDTSLALAVSVTTLRLTIWCWGLRTECLIAERCYVRTVLQKIWRRVSAMKVLLKGAISFDHKELENQELSIMKDTSDRWINLWEPISVCVFVRRCRIVPIHILENACSLVPVQCPSNRCWISPIAAALITFSQILEGSHTECSLGRNSRSSFIKLHFPAEPGNDSYLILIFCTKEILPVWCHPEFM